MELIRLTPEGFYCEAGGFHIDPWKPVERAVITHAHADHARWGSSRYLCAEEGRAVLQQRMGQEASIETRPFGTTIRQGDVCLSFHPAGHLLGSAQVRIEHRGEVWVISGDYKLQADPTCTPFEPVRCHTFISECTFGLPVYQWPQPETVFDAMNHWRTSMHEQGRSCLLLTYALGKAQRVLAYLDPSRGAILAHGAVMNLLPAYHEAGISLPDVLPATTENARTTRGNAFILAPPSAAGSPWVKKFGPVSTAFASGWMCIRGARRRRALDRGFVVSDHADWPGLLQAIDATGAERIGLTHGTTDVMCRWLQEQGREAWTIPTRFTGEVESDDPQTDQDTPDDDE